jgi:hypothetical protein
LWCTGVAATYRGCVTSGNPFNIDTHGDTTGSTNDPPSVSMTTTTANTLLVHWVGANDGAITYTTPTGFSPRFQQYNDNSGKITDKIQEIAGSTGTVSSTAGTSNPYGTWMGALLPAVGVNYDATGAGASSQNSAASLSWSHTGASNITAVVVAFAVGSVGIGSYTGWARSVTYGGVPMTSLGVRDVDNGTHGFIELFGLLNPLNGTQTVVASATKAATTPNSLIANSVSYTNVSAFSAIDITDSGGLVAAASADVVSTPIHMVFAAIAAGSNLSAPNQTQRYLKNVNTSDTAGNMLIQDAPGATSVTFSSTIVGGDNWTYLGVDMIPSISTLVDNFNAGFSEGVIWTALGDDPAKVTAVNGTIRVDHPATQEYNDLDSVNTYDLTSNGAYVQVVDFGNQSIVTHSVYLQFSLDSNNSIWIQAMNNQLAAKKLVAGVQNYIGSAITLDTTAHRWLRIHESGGTLYFDTAPDGATWTNRWSLTNPFAITSMSVKLRSGSNPESSGSYGIFDNFNTGQSGSSISNLSDNFNSGVRDSLWTKSGDTSQIIGQNNQLYISHTAAPQYNQLESVVSYNMASSAAYIQVLDVGNQSLASHEAQFCLSTAAASADNAVFMHVTGTVLQAYKRVATVQTQIGSNLTYNSAAHKWWRIRESDGTTYWDTAPDGVTWTNRWSAANPIIMTSIYPQIISGCWQTEASGSYSIFDNFNIHGPMSDLSDNFNTGANSTIWFKSGNPAEILDQYGAIYLYHTAVSEYNGLQALDYYDLTGNYAYVQVLDFGNQSLVSHQVIFYAFLDVNNWMCFGASNGILSASYKISGVQTQIGSNLTLDNTNHKWLRIREVSGTTYFDTAPDGVTWTNRWSVANPMAVTTFVPLLQTGCWQTEASGSYAIYDNFNIIDSSGISRKPLRIANGKVGPMALRRRYRRPRQTPSRRNTDQFFN